MSEKAANAAKNLLVAVAEGERDLEASRAALCRSYNFVPTEAFSRINRDNSKGIDIVELINFLKDNNVTDIDDAEVAHVTGVEAKAETTNITESREIKPGPLVNDVVQRASEVAVVSEHELDDAG
mgnify:CR=1 FL=1